MREGWRRLIRLILFLFTQTTTSGRENLPGKGGCILAINHLSRLDGPVVFAYLDRQDATGLVAKKYQRNPLIRWILNTVGVLWIDRSGTDYEALRKALKHLDAGGMLGIAPEGTRSPGRSLLSAKPGVAYLATKARAPIIPIAIRGTESVLSACRGLRRPRIHVRFGRPFLLPAMDRRDREASLRKNADEIMCQIAALLPERYRGMYADHPRLFELLNVGLELEEVE